MNILKFLPKKLPVMLALLLSITVSNVTYAGPIVTQWAYDTWAEFTSATFSGGSGATAQGLNEITWGATGGDYTNTGAGSSSAQSALTLGTTTTGNDRFGGGNVTGSVDTIMGLGAPTGTQIGVGISASHWNNTLSASFSTLESGTLTDYLNLSAVLPGLGVIQPAPTIGIDFKFQETDNAGVSGFCLNGDPVGSHAGGCPDIFGFAANLTVGIPFLYDGNMYALDILLTDGNGGAAPIAALGAGYCGALNLANDCVGLVTAEAAVTSFQFGFDIRHVSRVPEPSSLVLFALAIMFFGVRKYNHN